MTGIVCSLCMHFLLQNCWTAYILYPIFLTTYSLTWLEIINLISKKNIFLCIVVHDLYFYCFLSFYNHVSLLLRFFWTRIVGRHWYLKACIAYIYNLSLYKCIRWLENAYFLKGHIFYGARSYGGGCKSYSCNLDS